MGTELGPQLSSRVCVRRALFVLFSPPRILNLHLVGFSVDLMTGVIVLKRRLRILIHVINEL